MDVEVNNKEQRKLGDSIARILISDVANNYTLGLVPSQNER